MSYERSLLVSSRGDTMKGVVMESCQRQVATTVFLTSAPSYSVSYRCKKRFCGDVNSSKSCYVFAQASGKTEPSECVLGMESRFTNPAKVEQYVQRRSSTRPIQATEASTESDSEIEVGRGFRIDCKLFTCRYPEPLPHWSNKHISIFK